MGEYIQRPNGPDIFNISPFRRPPLPYDTTSIYITLDISRLCEPALDSTGDHGFEFNSRLCQGILQKLHEKLGKIHRYTRGPSHIPADASEGSMSHRPNLHGSDIPTFHRASQNSTGGWVSPM
jgi:hypothetical protein